MQTFIQQTYAIYFLFVKNLQHSKQQRVKGLYQELRSFNMISRKPASLRMSLARRTSAMDMRIEWGRKLPGHGDSTIRIRYKSSAKGKKEEKLKLPDIYQGKRCVRIGFILFYH